MDLVPLDAKAVAEVQKLKLQIALRDTNELPKKKKAVTVLDEDEYTRRVDSIIERDFYPDVTKLRADLEYQDALEKNDFERLQVLGKARLEANHRRAASVANTPATFETPMNTREPEFVPDVKLDPRDTDAAPDDANAEPAVDNLSLNTFMGKYTSEDNAAFEQLQEETTQKHLEKMKFLSGDVSSHNANVDSALALPSVATQMAAISAASTSAGGCLPKGEADKLITWKYTTKNSVMFDPDGAPLTINESAKMKLNQPVILHENTRFKARPFSVLPRQTPLGPVVSQVKPNALGKIGVDGKEANAGGATPAVNGFKYVPSTPTLAPGSIPESPLMTWGEIESTPVQLRGDATPLRPESSSTQFRMPEVPVREKAGQELANRILMTKKRKKDKAILVAESGTVPISMFGSAISTGNRTSLERFATMSPAAQMLGDKLGLAKIADRSLQTSYSPMMSPSTRNQHARTPTPRSLRVTPSPRSNLTPGASATTKQKRTVNLSSSSGRYQETSSHSGATKRPNASEFF